jgi:peroxiredoxin Q/BCP
MSSIAKSCLNSINIGDSAPNFDMPATGEKNISLTELAGKNIVLYFYPRDDTSGCTLEANDFRDNIQHFTALNTIVIGVSKDTLKSHMKFQEKYALPFALASDENTHVCEDYEVWKEKMNYGKKYMGIERSTFLIDKTGIIRHIWRKVKVTGHINAVLEAVKEL